MAQVPVKRDEIPFTQARLKSLIKIYVTYSGYQPDPNDPTAVPSLSTMSLLGAVTKITVKNPRGAQERRELNYDTAAEIQEMIPGLPTFDVSIQNIMTYAASFLEGCGFAGGELRFQTRPVALALVLPSPTPTTIPPKIVFLRGVWLGDNASDFSVQEAGDLRIIQDTPLHCAGLLEVK